MLIELLLQFFIGIVDAKLFKTIGFKSFKTINVQNTNKFANFPTGFQGFVDFNHDPVENFGVDVFG